MSRLYPAIAVAALLVGSGAIAQTKAPGDVAPNPVSPGAQAPSAQPVAPAPTTAPTGERLSPLGGTAPVMNEVEAKRWVDKAVYSADDKNVGSVAAIQRDASGKVTELHADVGGFLGIGTTRVRLLPSQFKLSGDRVVVNVPADQMKALPTISK